MQPPYADQTNSQDCFFLCYAIGTSRGGEKIFAKELEAVMRQHPAVYDALVCGRPSARRAQELRAVLQRLPGGRASEAELLAYAAQHLARFELARVIVFREHIERSPSGKPGYACARRQCRVEHP
jgi:acyl-CoA synthetase (AMP-forming)/AMP-acid ligase II